MQAEKAIAVLVVDDDPLLLAAMARYLRRRGMRAICANSPFGVSALVRKEEPDVIVLDYNMPGLDGGHLLRVLRTSPRTEKTPVVFHSGDPDSVVAPVAHSLGAHYSSKAAGPIQLVDTILSALRSAREEEHSAHHSVHA